MNVGPQFGISRPYPPYSSLNPFIFTHFHTTHKVGQLVQLYPLLLPTTLWAHSESIEKRFPFSAKSNQPPCPDWFKSNLVLLLLRPWWKRVGVYWRKCFISCRIRRKRMMNWLTTLLLPLIVPPQVPNLIGWMYFSATCNIILSNQIHTLSRNGFNRILAKVTENQNLEIGEVPLSLLCKRCWTRKQIHYTSRSIVSSFHLFFVRVNNYVYSWCLSTKNKAKWDNSGARYVTLRRFCSFLVIVITSQWQVRMKAHTHTHTYIENEWNLHLILMVFDCHILSIIFSVIWSPKE